MIQHGIGRYETEPSDDCHNCTRFDDASCPLMQTLGLGVVCFTDSPTMLIKDCPIHNPGPGYGTLSIVKN